MLTSSPTHRLVVDDVFNIILKINPRNFERERETMTSRTKGGTGSRGEKRFLTKVRKEKRKYMRVKIENAVLRSPMNFEKYFERS